MPHLAAAATPPPVPDRPLRPWLVLALALATGLFAGTPLRAAEEFTARGLLSEVASDAAGRITFRVRQADAHFWIEALPPGEQASLLERLHGFEQEHHPILVEFSILGAGIPDGQKWLEYRVQRLRPLAAPTEVYSEPHGAAHAARPELQASSPLDMALLRGVPLLASGRLDESLATLSAAVRAADEEPESGAWKVILAHKARGRAFMEQAREGENGPDADSDGALLEALADLREWQRLAPDDPIAQHEIGTALTRLGAYPEALAVYAGIRREWPVRSDWTQFGTAFAYRQMKDYRRSLAALAEVHGAERDSVSYHYQRGLTLEDSGRHADALAEFSAVLDSQPDYYWALLRRSCVRTRTGDLAEGLRDGRRAVELLALYPSEAGRAQNDLARAREITARLADGAGDQALTQCAQLSWWEEPRARSTLLPARITWLPLSRTPPRAHGLAALSATEFRLLVLAVLALVIGSAVVLLRKFAAPR